MTTGRPGRRRRAAPAWIAALLPGAVVLLLLVAWEVLVRARSIPPYILPAPSAVLGALAADWAILGPALAVTLRITILGFATALLGGLALGFLLTRARWAERAFAPIAVILQVTPLIAIAPIILIYAGTEATVAISVVLVAFFPVLAGTLVGLRSAEPGLRDLFALYRAKPLERLLHLELPSALPFILTGARTAAGLSLIGAVVAEFVAGTGGAGSGLAYRVVEASYRLNVPRLFAAVVLICLAGLGLYGCVALASRILLRRWHPSGR
ncbi:MAG: ABC transporter permease subunit [Alsobacter sp.]